MWEQTYTHWHFDEFSFFLQQKLSITSSKIPSALIMHKLLSSFSDLLNHYHKAAGHGVKTPSYFPLLCLNPFLFITYNLIYPLFFPEEPWESPGLFIERVSFLLVVKQPKWQKSCLTPLVRTSTDLIDFWKKLPLSVWIYRKIKQNKTAPVTKMRCHAIVWKICNIFHFSSPCVEYTCMYVCLCACAFDCKWKREGENLMNCLIYGNHQQSSD